ncbi:hypothetical protein AYO28_10905 [Pseudomonas putida]|uniref:Uncharacterized protein n=1 Tax=Pseudomonas putida TaxID=303 RepID=A0A177SUJ0_PSEPU|nr:hypothetical protein AYO28_10905 [Pseudomonas putida]
MQEHGQGYRSGESGIWRAGVTAMPQGPESEDDMHQRVFPATGPHLRERRGLVGAGHTGGQSHALILPCWRWFIKLVFV